jgi:DNA-binding MurR/RpiR family transcriptional regulator
MQDQAAPQTVSAFNERLREVGGGLPARLRQCAEFVAAHPDRIAVSTVGELAAAANVQPSAFMRFCKELGFTGFSQMQKLFREDYLQRWPDYSTRLGRLKQQGEKTPLSLLADFADAGRASLESLVASIDAAALERCVALLSAARTVHIVGFRRAFPVASYLAYAFDRIGVPALLHSGLGNLTLEHMLGPQDAMIAISFAPYTDETVTIARQAEAAGLAIVAITDVMTSPLARLKAEPLYVTEIDVDAFRGLSATVALAITLAVSVGARRNRA